MTFQNQAYSGISAVSFVGKEILFDFIATFLVFPNPPHPPMQSLESQMPVYVMTLFWSLHFCNIVTCQVMMKMSPVEACIYLAYDIHVLI